MNLTPTHLRLSLLRDVDDGQVCFAPNGGGVQNLNPDAGIRRDDLLSEMTKMRRAGWVTLPLTEGSDVLGSYYYELTDVGRDVLKRAGVEVPGA